jgi:hypothetical protein
MAAASVPDEERTCPTVSRPIPEEGEYLGEVYNVDRCWAPYNIAAEAYKVVLM